MCTVCCTYDVCVQYAVVVQGIRKTIWKRAYIINLGSENIKVLVKRNYFCMPIKTKMFQSFFTTNFPCLIAGKLLVLSGSDSC